MEWYLKVIRNYAGFHGRASRKEYWMFNLINLIILIPLTILELIIDLEDILTGIYSLATLLPSLAVGVRRLHDIGKSGWWLLINIIPFVGFIIIVVLCCQNSHESDNQYGPNPRFNYS